MEKLIASFDKMMEVFWNYPKIIDLLYFGSIEKSPLGSSPLLKELKDAHSGLTERNKSMVSEILGSHDDELIMMKINQLRGGIMYPALAKGLDEKNRIYFSDPVNRKEYVRKFVHIILDQN